MRTEVITANTIDVAVEKILVELGVDTTSSIGNAIYFDGWDGLGASAVLQAVAECLTISNKLTAGPIGLGFEIIIHIDCSKWESRRAMQRKIAEQLKLPNWVMDMFDKQDEEDDFNGLDQGSRSEIPQVVREIHQTTQNRRFVVILHNGSNEEIDLFKFGLSFYEYANSKMLWTFQGRFRLDPKMIDNVKKSTTTGVLLSASSDKRCPKSLWSYLAGHEAAKVCYNKYGHDIINPAIASDCVLYMLKQSCMGSHGIDYDRAMHTSNYWVCAGIVALSPLTDTDVAWKVGDALQREVQLLNIDNRLNNDESKIMPSSQLARFTERMAYWISAAGCGFVQSHSGVILDNIFQYSHMLRVLKLFWCTFSFSSPPFVCCHSLRFLWLDHCQDALARRSTTDLYQELDDSTTMSLECFKSLWVLDLRYTDLNQFLSAQVIDVLTQIRELNVVGAKNWDMSHLKGRLRNIRKLRVTKSTCFSNDFSTMESLELLDFSGNTIRLGSLSLDGTARNHSLETVIIDGFDGLKCISLRGCKELKNVFLKGLFPSLVELDLSGTNVKTLDLREVESNTPAKRIILLGCKKLHAILWPQEVYTWFDVLLIDTTSTSTSASAHGGELAPHAYAHGDRSLQQQKEEEFKGGWQISLTDARLLRSLSPAVVYLTKASVHLDIGPAGARGNVQGTTSDKLVQVQPHTSTIMDCKYRDVLREGSVAAMMMRDCPEIYLREDLPARCIIKVVMHEGLGNKLSEDTPSASASLPDFICEQVTSLHVYNNSSISTPVPPNGSGWKSLRWCRVERCPKLPTVFTVPKGSAWDIFYYLQTFWASQLLTTCYIWENWDVIYLSTNENHFPNLKFLHLDYCPRLVHVLPICARPSYYMSFYTTVRFSYNIETLQIETLEIVYCGDLREVIPLSPEHQKKDTATNFPKLRRIHLHELPVLQHICGRRMFAPKLETIKIRGCWSLRRLPAIGRDTKPPKVDCEKEWWDNLEWDGMDKYHHPSLYEPRHSKYYKAKLPRGSLLR